MKKKILHKQICVARNRKKTGSESWVTQDKTKTDATLKIKEQKNKIA